VFGPDRLNVQMQYEVCRTQVQIVLGSERCKYKKGQLFRVGPFQTFGGLAGVEMVSHFS
jgi:hypothetical protein